MHKRVLALIISAAMILNTFPLQVFAEGEETALPDETEQLELIEEDIVVETVNGELELVTEELLQMDASSGTCGTNLTWTLSDDGVLTISGEGEMEDYTHLTQIPWYEYSEQITGLVIEDGVTTLGEFAFYGFINVTNTSIPDSLTAISDFAFACWNNLSSITIPENVTSIGSNAFSWCTSLTSITIPESVTSIDSGAFDGCSSLTSITIPEGVTSIAAYTFRSCGSLTSITIPENVASIGDYAFKNCSNLSSITLHQGVTSIGNGTFQGCSNLTSIIIPEGVTSIGYFAFGNSGLTNITIPKSVTSIGDHAFYKCKNLTSVTLSGGITEIYDNMFQFCSKLASIVIPEGVTEIHYQAFANCPSLSEISLPVSLTKVNSLLDDCTALETIIYAGTEYQFNRVISINSPRLSDITVIYNGQSSNSYTYEENTDGTLTLTGYDGWLEGIISLPGEIAGKKVTHIGDSAFYRQNKVTSLTIPNGVTSIGNDAFYACKSLTSVSIPTGVVSIGDRAFSGCSSLTDLTIPSSVRTIGHSAFYDCSGLTSITIHAGVTSIGDYTFCGCSNLTSITIPDTVTSMGEGALAACGFTSATLSSNLTTIAMYALGDCPNLTTITIPDGVTKIKNAAFINCANLTDVVIPVSVTEIDDSAFALCDSPTDVYYSGTEEEWTAVTIGSDNEALTSATIHFTEAEQPTYLYTENSDGTITLTGCEGELVGDVTLPSTIDGKTVTGIGSKAFQNCTEVTSMAIPEGVTIIESYVFQNCSKLSSVSLPASLTSISSYTFDSVPALKSVTIPASVKSLYSNTFVNCTSLESIIFLGNTSLLNYWVKGCTVLETIILPENSGYTFNNGMLYSSTELVTVVPTKTGEVVVPDGITRMSYAFDSCSKIESIVIPDTAYTLYYSAYSDPFASCTSLKNITHKGTEAQWERMKMNERDWTGVTITHTGTARWLYKDLDDGSISIISYTGALEGDIEIPGAIDGKKVADIGDSALCNFKGMTGVVIPDGVTTIYEAAFLNCSDLTSVVIPSSMVAIYDDAFYGCSKLTEIIFNGTETQWNAILNVNEAIPAGVTVTCTATETVMKPKYFSMSLDGMLVMNLYMELSDDVVADKDSYVKFTVAGQEQKVYTKDLSPTSYNGGTYYVYQCKLNAKQLTDTIYIQMFLGDGSSGPEYTKTCKEYIDKKLASTDEIIKPLTKALANYGAYAQINFNYNSGNLPNTGLSEAEKQAIDAVTAETVASYKNSKEGSVEGLTISSVTLLVESGTVLRFYFTLDSEHSIEEYSFKRSDNEQELSAKYSEKYGMYYVDIEGIVAFDLDEEYSVTVTDNGANVMTVSSSPLSYVRSVLNNDAQTEATKNLAKAIYLYNQEANTYFGK